MKVEDVKKVIVKKQKVVFVDKKGNRKAFKKHPVILALIDKMIEQRIISLDDVVIDN